MKKQIEDSPLVSVILPVYNCEKYIFESITSILSQTYHNIELLVIDDGSTDDTWKIIQTFSDSRIKAKKQENAGLPTTLNRLINLSEGEFIARQDADDISHHDRIEKQMSLFSKNPDLGIVGTWSNIIDEAGNLLGGHTHPLDNNSIKAFLYFDSPFVHTSVLFKKSLAIRAGLYETTKERQPEDYGLWTKMAALAKMGNVGERLVTYREVKGSLSRKSLDPFPYLPNLIGEYIYKRLFKMVPKKYCVMFAKIYHRKNDTTKKLVRYSLVALICVLVVLREQTLARRVLGRIKAILQLI